MADDKDDDFDLVRLDKSRNYDRHFPIYKGAEWFQDGLHFTPDGRLATELLDEETKGRVRRKVARAKAEAAATRARREALKKAGIDPDAKDDDAPEPAAPRSGKTAPKTAETTADAATIDLPAWARGEINVTWFKVRQAFVVQHSREVDNKQDALIFLADEGLISADEVNV